MEIAPDNLEYDKSEKVYRATSLFSPVLTPPDSQSFLNQLLEVTAGTLSPSLSFIGWRPPCDVVKFPTRAIRPDILMRVIWAIRDGEEVELDYQSMRRPAATRRWIAPHAIAFDGSRWHTRAWCHENRDFRDFVFSRIQQIHGSRKSEVDPHSDARWHSFVTVILRPRSGLTEHQRVAVEVDFGMKNGVLQVPMREALVFYFARQLQLDREGGPSVHGQPIEWVNEKELRPLLLEATRK
jgi:predicted DNA-binding transcriptional regulator YafY